LIGANRRPALAMDSMYKVCVITRNASSPEARKLTAIPGVTIFEGDCYDERALREAFVGIEYVFANTNGLAIGEKNEIYWGIRLYELAREFGIVHFIYAGLEYASKLGNFNPKYRTPNLDAKGKVVDYVKSQPTSPMAWSCLTSCPYIEGLSQRLAPRPDPSDPGTWVFTAPLGAARCPLIYLEDYGKYARWMFDNPERSNGMELHVATEDIAWADLVTAFTEATGRKAVYRDLDLDEYFASGFYPYPNAKIGAAMNPTEPTLVTVKENFSGFWNTWKDELTKRDYDLLDEILPSRVKSVKEWMVKTGYTGEVHSALR
jgi:hypothetical protein